MLRGIPRAISPDLMKCMMEMGHGDVLVLVDANYPAHSHGKRVIRMDHVEIPELLEAALQFFSLDYFVDNPVRLMKIFPRSRFRRFGRHIEALSKNGIRIRRLRTFY